MTGHQAVAPTKTALLTVVVLNTVHDLLPIGLKWGRHPHLRERYAARAWAFTTPPGAPV